MSSTDYALAFAAVKRVCLPNDIPVLTYGNGQTPTAGLELDDIIVAAQRAVVWTAGTYLRSGQFVLSTVRGGQIFEVVRAGTSGVSEPSWSTGAGTWPYSDSGATTVVDNGVTYRVWDDSVGLYDIREACKQACLLKARKIATSVDFSADGVSIKNSQLRDFWLDEAKRFEAVCV